MCFLLPVTAQADVVARWTFATAQGETVSDVSGHDHPASLMGGCRVATDSDVAFGAAHGVMLDGSAQQKIDYGSTRAFNFQQGFTLAVWVKPSALPDGETMILGKDSTLYGLSLYKNGSAYLYVAGGSNNISVPLPMGQWSYLAGTYDGARMKLYLNGALKADKPLVLSGNASLAHILATSPRQSLVTGPTPGLTAWFTGAIAQAAVYDAALSAEQIRQQYAHESPVLSRPGIPMQSDSPQGPWSVPLQARWWQADTNPLAAEPSLDDFDRLSGRTKASLATRQTISHSQVQDEDGHVTFSIPGDPTYVRTMRWSMTVEDTHTPCMYYVLRYRAQGINRGNVVQEVIGVTGLDSANQSHTQPLALDSQLFNDGLWHTLIGKLVVPIRPGQVNVRLETTDSHAWLAIGELRFFASIPTGDPARICEGGWRPPVLQQHDFQYLDLHARFNATTQDLFRQRLDTAAIVCDGLSDFPLPQITVEGVPFSVKVTGNNLIRPAQANPNSATTQFLGATVSRENFFPAGRDDTTAFDIGRKVSEVFLLLAGNQPVSESRYSVPAIPYSISDIDAIAVELQYADGRQDFVFPYSMADSGYCVRRQIGGYVVPVDDTRTLKRAILHNRLVDKTFAVAAVTLNTSKERAFPQLVKEPPLVHIPQLPTPPLRTPQLKQADGILTVANRYYEVEIDCRAGFSIRRLVNLYAPNSLIRLNDGSGLAIKTGSRLFTGKSFHTRSIIVTGTTATIQLTSDTSAIPLSLTVRTTADDSPQLQFDLTVTNVGTKPLNAEIIFPILSDLSLGNPHDTWLYFPAYRSVMTNRPGFYRAFNDRSFTVQFYDVYNPVAGYGIGLLTHNRAGAPLDYYASKSHSGASAGVIYPADFYSLPPSDSVRLTETALCFHPGDWHDMLDQYRQWLASWFKHPNAQARAWFQKVWLIASVINSDTESASILQTPGIFDRKTRQYRVDEVLAADKEYYGMLPDVVHFYNWFYSDLHHEEAWGDYSTQSYDNAGGLSLFRSAISKIQDQHYIPVSLYLIPDRISKSSNFAKVHGKEVAARRADGSLVEDSASYSIDPANALWRDYFVRTTKRVQSQTAAKAIYIDVFPYPRGDASYDSINGRQALTWTNKASNDLLRQLRVALPANVGLYCEFPPTDLNAGLLDGNICYYNLTLNELFARHYNVDEQAQVIGQPIQSIERFAFPRLRQVGFTVGIEGDDNKGLRFKPLFFNGEGIFDVTHRLYPGPFRHFLQHSLALRKQYADCFTTASPTPLVPTDRAGLYANEFPGDRRTLWTLYNARFTPLHGRVMTIRHHPGATYFDAWNNRPLTPSIHDGWAEISLDLQPQAIGCIVQATPQ